MNDELDHNDSILTDDPARLYCNRSSEQPSQHCAYQRLKAIQLQATLSTTSILRISKCEQYEKE
jgi:hypothetical protein